MIISGCSFFYGFSFHIFWISLICTTGVSCSLICLRCPIGTVGSQMANTLVGLKQEKGRSSLGWVTYTDLSSELHTTWTSIITISTRVSSAQSLRQDQLFTGGHTSSTVDVCPPLGHQHLHPLWMFRELLPI